MSKIAAGKRALFVQLLSRVVDFLLRIKRQFCGMGIELSFLNLLREAGAGCCGVTCFRLFEFALVFSAAPARSPFSSLANNWPCFTLEPRWT